MTNSSIYSNTAGYDGGDIFNGSPYGFAGEVMSMTNSTVVSNTTSGSGGGFYNWNSASVTLDNSILWGNSAPTGPQIYTNSTNRPTISTSDVQGSNGSGAGWNTILGSDGGGNIDIDPLFLDREYNNLRLDFSSPAIDTGSNADCPATDMDGLPRPSDGDGVSIQTCDMGAYEAGTLVCSVGDGSYNFPNQPGLNIMITTLGSDLACLYVDEMGINHPIATSINGGDGTMSGRYWQIRALKSDSLTLATGYVATLTLPHSVIPHTEAYVCKYLGSASENDWDCSRSGSDASTVWLSGISSFSDWTVGDYGGATDPLEYIYLPLIWR